MKKSISILILITLIFSFTGCVKIKNTKQAVSVGGFFVSQNQGKNWVPQIAIASTPENPATIGNFNITNIVLDPQDPNTIYLGTEANGMFISYNNAQTWMQFPSMAIGHIYSIAVDPKNKCTIYTSTANKILKSADCGRTWEQIYFDTRANVYVTSIAIDNFDTNVIYAGNLYGEVLQSKDAGKSWTTLYRANNEIIEIMLGKDTRKIFAATKDTGILKSTDKGATWTKIYDKLLEIAYPSLLTDMDIDYKNNVIIIANSHGLLRSNDEGETWESIPLLTAPGSTVIYSIAVNSENSNELYYGTASTFYQTIDGGKNWISSQLPVPSIAKSLLLNPANANILYMGVKKIEQ